MRDYMIQRSFRGFVAPMIDTGATRVSVTSSAPVLTAANPPSKATPTGYATPGGGLTVAAGRTKTPPTTMITKTPSGEILAAETRDAASMPDAMSPTAIAPSEDPEAVATSGRAAASDPALPSSPTVYSSGGSTSMTWASLPTWARWAIALGVIGVGAGGTFLLLRRRPRRR